MLEKSKLIKDLSLHRERPFGLRPNVLQYPFLYLLVVALDWNFDGYYIWLALPVVAIGHIFTFLMTFWSTDFAARMNCFNADINNATCVKISPQPHKGGKSIVPIVRDPSDNSIYFYYQKRKYTWNPDKKIFTKIHFTIEPMGFYMKAKGLASDQEVAEAQKKFGRNVFDIPMPKFMDLYKEQMIQPFFVFQVFCVLLWLLDDYFYYSLFILALLLVFEATVVRSRLASMSLFRKMTIPEIDILVLRKGTWSTVKSSELVPGDLCCLRRTEDEVLIPCDMLLISGSCISNEAMLTGESTPQIKEPISFRAADEVLNPNQDKLHILFAGTKIVKHSTEENKQAPKGNGCVAYVLRTGFNTSQGKLVRTILFSSERVTENNKESFFFIFLLLIFALCASGYVLYEGLKDEARSRYKLLLECTLIITSVVPPELPMQLSLAVNTSLINLTQKGIFCTEPFRIPFAGKIDIAAFDKTGTLTQEHLIMRGVVFPPGFNPAGIDGDTASLPENDNNTDAYLSVGSIPPVTQYVMAGCHALATINNDLVGDPVEIAAIKHISWTLGTGETSVSTKRSQRLVIRMRHRFHFQSALKRMSTIVSLDHNEQIVLAALVKGAPETIQEFLSVVPEGYEETYKAAARRGGRVIALAYKKMTGDVSNETLHKLHRQEVESDLTFCGFMVFECPLKEDSALAISALHDSSHETIMITGDSPLTACEVARELKMTTKPTLILQQDHKTGSMFWLSIDETFKQDFALPVPKDLVEKYDFCLSGDTLTTVLSDPKADEIIKHAVVYARTSPEQKGSILAHMKNHGRTTMMCGDGTNDVGALKQAHVGVALLPNGPDPRLLRVRPVIGQPPPAAGAATTATGKGKLSGSAPRKPGAPAKQAPPPVARPKSAAEAFAQMKRQMEELDAQDKPPIVQLGDASIASPFTSRGASILPLLDIIRQGRCTLVTTLQMFKILALNCLIYAYSLSVLYLEGIKYGDTQATIIGLLTAMIFLFISRSQPLDRLSKQRPISNLFSPYMIISVLGQFVIHLASLMYIVDLAMTYREGPKPTPDAEFAPNIVNSAVFLISTSMQVATFAINYQGHPFMQSVRENKGLFYSLFAIFGILFVTGSEIMPEFNVGFDLVIFPGDFRFKLVAVMALDYGLAWCFEQVCKWLLYK